MAFSGCREPYVGDFTPSPSTASESLPSIGSSTPRSLGGDLPSLPFTTPLSTLSARLQNLDMNHTIERFLTFRRPSLPVSPCWSTHAHHQHAHPCHGYHHTEDFATHNHHTQFTIPSPIPRVSLDRLHQFHQRHSCPPELSNGPSNHTNFTNLTSTSGMHPPAVEQHRSSPPLPVRTRKTTKKTSPTYQSKAIGKCRAAAKTRSKASSTRASKLTPLASAIASGIPSTIKGAPVTVTALRKPRAKQVPPRNIEALAHLFTKCVRYYTDFTPGPKVYFATEELMYNYREILDGWTPPPDDRWKEFARRYVTEDGKELYQCLLLKADDKQDCACRYGQTRQAVRRHINDVHLNIRNWKCPFDGCDKAFKQRNTLKIHTFVKHTGETPYLCIYCQDRFSDPAQRNKHYKFIHSDQKHPKRIKQAHDLPMNEADVYGCFFCPERCVDSMSRAIHCQEYHPDKFVPPVTRAGKTAPSPVVLDDDECEECDHEDGCDCEFL